MVSDRVIVVMLQQDQQEQNNQEERTLEQEEIQVKVELVKTLEFQKTLVDMHHQLLQEEIVHQLEDMMRLVHKL